MKKFSILLLRITGILSALVIIMLVTAGILLNTDSMQNKLLQYALGFLREDLQTEVKISHVNVNVLKQHVNLCGLDVRDQKGRRMLEVERLSVGFSLPALFRKEVVVTGAHLSGLKAFLRKEASDSVANYQILIEALKSHKTKKDRDKGKKRHHVGFDVARATVDIDSLCYMTDNGRPRRNVAKPHHGAFDAGHLDLAASMRVKLKNINEHGFSAEVRDFKGTDKGSGLNVTHLQLEARMSNDSLWVSDLLIQLPNTRLSIPDGVLQIPKKSVNHPLRYRASNVEASTQLRDIAQPFAPVLKNFKIPIHLHCALTGDDSSMHFNKVRITTDDNRLHITAKGNITHLRRKQRPQVHFDISQMTSIGDVKTEIIHQFPVKKFMMKQLHALGRLDYKGHLNVREHHVALDGNLHTEAGAILFDFDIDGHNKYLSGNVKTNSFHLGRVMEMDKIGQVACKARFNIDISKQRTAMVRKERGGKLPIGNVDAFVYEGHLKYATVHNVSATISSDGAQAEGVIANEGNLIDLGCSFIFTDLDEMKKLKIRPKLKIHLKNKKERKKEKALRKLERAETKL